MKNHAAPLDAVTFLRTTSLFEEKRKVLAPHAVRALAEEIVHRVSTMNHSLRKDAAQAVSDASLSEFCKLLGNASPSPALQFVLDRQDEGMERTAIVNGYLAEGARKLGEKWDSDEIGLPEVIHGTGHLYALLRALRTDPAAKNATSLSRRNALFALVPGETHKFGIQLAADTFREAGWKIDLQVGSSHDDLVRHVQHTEPTIIGLSLSTEARLADLVKLVIALRLERPSSIIGVAPALNMEESKLRSVVDIDLVFRDARTAVQDLDWMRQLKS